MAVTTSVKEPNFDFEVNCIGTLNLLEGIRRNSPNTFFLNASTNKVYGGLDGVSTSLTKTRYSINELPNGIDEKFPLDFHSPYGCSKGSADKYTIDYSRIYGIKTCTFRQSCIYGPFQYGIEDQGWLAWFSIAALTDKAITIYGDGFQVRDLLYIDDLCKGYELAFINQNIVNGQAFNMGGGAASSLSIKESLDQISSLLQKAT